jgi:hypothetical protein
MAEITAAAHGEPRLPHQSADCDSHYSVRCSRDRARRYHTRSCAGCLALPTADQGGSHTPIPRLHIAGTAVACSCFYISCARQRSTTSRSGLPLPAARLALADASDARPAAPEHMLGMAQLPAMGVLARPPMALAPPIIRWGLNASSDTLRECTRCNGCGHRGGVRCRFRVGAGSRSDGRRFRSSVSGGD